MSSLRGLTGRWFVACLLLGSVITGVARADLASGVQWLSSQTQQDGSYLGPADIATPYQATSETVRAFTALAAITHPSTTPAVQFLQTDPSLETEYLARRIVASVIAGQDVSASVTELLTHQDSSTGGFGDFAGYDPSILETAYALEALAYAASAPAAAKSAIGYLQQRQNANGSWNEGVNDPSVFLTALSATAIAYYQTSSNVGATLQSATAYLFSSRESDGLWGQDFLTAQSLLALEQTLSDQSALAPIVQSLSAHQAADGSWGDDVYTTAVVARALSLSQRHGQNGNTAAVEGYVRIAGSLQPASGATVTLFGAAALSVQTNADGYYLMKGLPTGSVTLVASKAGLTSASTVAQISPAQTSDAPDLIVGAAGQTGAIRLHLFSAATGASVSGATVTLSGTGSYVANSDSTGSVSLDAVQPDSYALTIHATGYADLHAMFSVSGGSLLKLEQALWVPGPAITATDVSGSIVDGISGAPITTATIDLGGGHAAATDQNGAILLPQVAAGSYTAVVSAPGYATQTYEVIVGGSPASMGKLLLYQTNSTTTPSSVTLVGQVLDGLSNQPLAGASISIAGSSLSATSDSAGRFTIAGISSLTFQISISAAGHSAFTQSLAAPAFGSFSTSFAIPPTGTTSATTVIAGYVRNSSTNAVIVGATVAVQGSSLKSQTDSSGHYQLSGLPASPLTLQVTALNFTSQTLTINVASQKTYSLDISMAPATASNGFQILSLSTTDSGKGANQVQTFTTQIGNASTATVQGTVLVHILDATGAQIATVTPVDPVTGAVMSDITLTASQIQSLQIPWNPARLAPGAYTVQLDVIVPGSAGSALPSGTVLAESSIITSVAATNAISGALAFNPPLTQVGSSSPVDLQVVVTNNGNAPLNSLQLSLTITDATNAVIETRNATLSSLSVGEFEYLSFGSWTPTAGGNLTATVRSSISNVSGQFSGPVYVGDRPTGVFTVTPTAVPVGNQTVHGQIQVTGVDVRANVDTTFAYQAKQAATRGASYVASTGSQQTTSSHCMKCHVTTQSFYGLASLINHDIVPDAGALKTLRDAITGVQEDDGTLQNYEPQFSLTETTLAEWALSQSPDKVDLFPTEYRAATYLLSRVTTSGNKTNWNPDYATGWWYSTDSHNMMVTKTFVDLIQTSRGNDLSHLQTFQLGPQVATAASSAGWIKAGPDGMLYVLVPNNRTVQKIDPTTGVVQTVVASTIDAPVGMEIAGANDIYVVTQDCCDGGRKLRHFANGTSSITVGLPSNTYDIALGPDNKFYIVGDNFGRVFRISKTGVYEQVAANGIFNLANGVAVAPDGTVYVGNSQNYTISKIAPNGAVSLVANTMFTPNKMTVAADGSLYFISQLHVSGEVLAVFRVDTQGYVHRLFSYGGASGITDMHGTPYVVSTSGAISKIVSVQLDTSQLSAMQDKVSSTARYTLSVYNNGTTDNIVQAMRLRQLAEANKIITDSSLLSQMSTAMQTINSLLRSRQHVDGGWGVTTGGSDPMSTALVGLALDTQGPAANDPVLKNAVTYLINAQRSDNSWTTGLMTQNPTLASTSMVMSYLPEAVDRFAGISVDLHLNVPSTVSLINPSVAPTSTIVVNGGETDYTFKLPDVSSTGRTLTFDMALSNLQQNEARLVTAASGAYLLSTNSYSNDQVRVDLSIPAVHATDGLALTLLTTDKATYLPSDSAQITAKVGSVAPQVTSGTVTFAVYASADDSLVATLPTVAFANLATNQSASVSNTWAVGATLAGGYYVVANLFDSSGASAGTLRDNLAVGASTGSGDAASLRVTTDRQSYSTTDQISIGDLVQNLTANQPIDSASLVLQVSAPSGVIVLNTTSDLGQLAPGATTQRSNALALNRAEQGVYTASAQVKDVNGTVIAHNSVTFSVSNDLTKTIRGSVAAQAATLSQGQDQVCSDTVTNNGSQSANSLQLQQLLIRLDVDQLITTIPQTASLAAGETQTLPQQTAATGPLTPGDYACVLQIAAANAWTTIGSASFKVTPEPIQLSTSVNTDRGTYDTTDQVTLIGQVQSLMHWRAAQGAVLHLAVMGPNQTLVFGQDIALEDLAPQSTLIKTTSFPLNRASEGVYAIRASVTDVTGQEQASAIGGFQVVENLARTIIGSVAVDQESIYQGRDQICTDSLYNDGVHHAADLQVRQVFTRVDSSQVTNTDSVIDLPAGATRTLMRVIPTTSLDVGHYACSLQVFVNNGWLARGAPANFEVKLEPFSLTESVTADHAIYDTTAQAQLTAQIGSLNQYRTLKGAKVVFTVVAASGTQQFTQTLALADLAPQASASVQVTDAYTRTAEGIYTVHAAVVDGSGQELKSATTTFQIHENQDRTITAAVSSEKASAYRGEEQSCTDSVSNSGIVNASGLQIRQILYGADPSQPVTTTSLSIDVAAGATNTLPPRSIATGPLALGSYSCDVAALINGRWKDLAHSNFDVREEPHHVSETIATDHGLYDVVDQVLISDSITNLAQYRIEKGDVLQIRLTSPAGITVLSQDLPLQDLNPADVASKSVTYTLNHGPEGTYALKGNVIDGSGVTIASADAQFDVHSSIGYAVTGTTAAQLASLTQGDPQSCTDVVSSNSQYPFSGVQIREKLVRTDVYKLIDSTASTINLDAQGSQSLPRSIATGSLTAGSYACKLELYVGNTWKPLSSAAFIVKPEPTHVTTTVSTDKPVYNAPTPVQITGVVNSLMMWRTLSDGTVHFDVVSPAGSNVYSTDLPLSALAPGATLSVPTTYGPTTPLEGTYTVNEKVIDGDGIDASTSTTFAVHKTFAQAISGTSSVLASSVYQGDTQSCTDKVISSSLYPLSSLQVRETLINTDLGTTTIPDAPSTVSLAANGTQTVMRSFSTKNYTLGNYACSLDAYINNAWVNLSSAAFQVTPPPVRVDATLGMGDKGRLLVLMDAPTDHSSGGALCSSQLSDVSFEIDLDHNLSPSAVVEVKLLNSLGLLVDDETVGLRSFTGEVNARAGSSNTDLSIPSFATDALVIAIAGTGADHALNGTYKLVANITDPAGNLAFNSGLFSLTCNTVGAINDTIGQVFRVIGVNNSTHTGTGIGDGNDTVSAANQKTYLQGLLNLDGWSYDIVTSKDDFATRMRGGAYQNFALLSEYEVLDDQVQRELRENVFGQSGLLNAGRHDVRRRILDNPLGIEYRGTQLAPVGVQMLASSPYLSGLQSSFTQGNNVQRTTLQGATLDGNVISSVTTQQTSLVTHYGYGNGKSAYFGFDLLAEASAGNATGSLFANLIRQPLNLVNPPQTTPLAGRVVPVRLTLANENVANTSTTVITASTGAYITNASTGTIAGGAVTWTTMLDIGQTKAIDIWVQLPNANIPVTLTAVTNSHSDLYIAAPVTTAYALTPVVRPSLDSAITDLTGYVNAQPPSGLLGFLLDPILGIKTPAAAALDQLKAANSDLNNGRVGKALSELVNATDYLINDGAAGLKPIRLEVDEAIFQTEKLQ